MVLYFLKVGRESAEQTTDFQGWGKEGREEGQKRSL
jgi:hypothetical protein